MALELVASNLSVDRGGRAVLRGLSFTAQAGAALLLTGPNGAGKTTLIRTIAGFIKPSGGSLRLDGVGPDSDVAEHCHYVGHANAIKAGLTVIENARFWADYLGGMDSTNPAEAALERFGLLALADIPAGYLSAGQKRRLGLSRLLLASRPVWLLDEPTVSLDAASTAILAEIVDAHVAAGGIAIAATHLALGLTRTHELRLGTAVAAAA